MDDDILKTSNSEKINEEIFKSFNKSNEIMQEIEKSKQNLISDYMQWVNSSSPSELEKFSFFDKYLDELFISKSEKEAVIIDCESVEFLKKYNDYLKSVDMSIDNLKQDEKKKKDIDITIKIKEFYEKFKMILNYLVDGKFFLVSSEQAVKLEKLLSEYKSINAELKPGLVNSIVRKVNSKKYEIKEEKLATIKQNYNNLLNGYQQQILKQTIVDSINLLKDISIDTEREDVVDISKYLDKIRMDIEEKYNKNRKKIPDVLKKDEYISFNNYNGVELMRVATVNGFIHNIEEIKKNISINNNLYTFLLYINKAKSTIKEGFKSEIDKMFDDNKTGDLSISEKSSKLV